MELTEEVKRIGCAEPSTSSYHVRRMEKMEDVDKLEDELQNNEARALLVKYNFMKQSFLMEVC